MNSILKKASGVCLGGALFVVGFELGAAFGKGQILGIMQATGLNANELLEQFETIDKTKMQKIRVCFIKDVARWSCEKKES